MLDIFQSYCNMIIKPIEEQKKQVLIKLYSKNIFYRMNRKYYSECLKKYDELIYEKYVFLGETIKQEREINEKLLTIIQTLLRKSDDNSTK